MPSLVALLISENLFSFALWLEQGIGTLSQCIQDTKTDIVASAFSLLAAVPVWVNEVVPPKNRGGFITLMVYFQLLQM